MVKSTKRTGEPLPTTGAVAAQLAKELGQPVTERLLSVVLRDWPEERKPRLVGRLRRWTPEDVAQMREAIEARTTARAAG